jgi:hypothetical protein
MALRIWVFGENVVGLVLACIKISIQQEIKIRKACYEIKK